jgi:hypothetical protein
LRLDLLFQDHLDAKIIFFHKFKCFLPLLLLKNETFHV